MPRLEHSIDLLPLDDGLEPCVAAAPVPDEVECAEPPLVEVSAGAVRAAFRDVRVLASGWYTTVFSARHRGMAAAAGRRVVVKAVRRAATTREDFMREARHHALLSACPHVLACFPPALATPASFLLLLEEAAAGDLASLVGRGGVGEAAARRMAAQVAAAVAFTHGAGLVHRDLTPANLLVKDAALRHVRLSDFGATRLAGTRVTRGLLPLPWLAPEVACLAPHDLYTAQPAQDAWQLGLLLLALLTGALPWAAADTEDPHYAAWAAWACRSSSTLPPRFRAFSPRFLRLLRRLLHPDPERRCGAAAVQREAEGGHAWLARDPDPFAPRPAALLRRAEQKVTRALRRYLRRASPRYKTVTFADELEQRREVEPRPATPSENEDEDEDWQEDVYEEVYCGEDRCPDHYDDYPDVYPEAYGDAYADHLTEHYAGACEDDEDEDYTGWSLGGRRCVLDP
ncbi:serine/threonine-protein kinase SBK1-like [Eriocheir sinensis]|uniref:serine/threonine-protein kinase SBK1-like n=1 Tax=Eriocheir sinensis TaxID=95602 RepID=UPI0021CA47FB|nr:serine/threonine-protein kinase SBK1-like [Eriocheir sinensis]XP_050699797.1 serine/threonine-protein kinase SBK1-like [Eriocheir sinensis]